MPAFWPHAESLDWWDGPDRHKRVNRCQVAEIQNEATLATINALAPGRKIDMGGPSVPLGMANPVMRGWETCNLRQVAGATVTSDACATPFEDGRFAVVFTFHSIEHIYDPRRFMRECDRILQAHGLLCVVCPHKMYAPHDMQNMESGLRCFNEWLPEELLALFKEILPAYEVLSFDTRQNNYDFEILARKPR